MTVEEKREALREYCNSKSCGTCPLNSFVCNFKDDQTVEDYYTILFDNKPPKNDPVNRPSHYTDGKIEVIEFIEDKNLGFCLGNAVKYIARAGKKDPTKEIEDLNKAKWYIERRIKELKGVQNG